MTLTRSCWLAVRRFERRFRRRSERRGVRLWPRWNTILVSALVSAGTAGAAVCGLALGGFAVVAASQHLQPPEQQIVAVPIGGLVAVSLDDASDDAGLDSMKTAVREATDIGRSADTLAVPAAAMAATMGGGQQPPVEADTETPGETEDNSGRLATRAPATDTRRSVPDMPSVGKSVV